MRFIQTQTDSMRLLTERLIVQQKMNKSGVPARQSVVAAGFCGAAAGCGSAL